MKGLLLIFFLSAGALVAGGCGGSSATSGTGGAGNGVGGSGNGAGTHGGSAGAAGVGSGGQGTGGTGGSAGTGGSGTGGTGGAAGSGSAGKTGGGGAGGTAGQGAGGANGGASGTAGSSCPGAQPLTGNQCRSRADCTPYPSELEAYACEINPVAGCATPNCAMIPVHDCTIDTDCPTGDICVTSPPIACCGKVSMTCQVSCATAGFTCPANTVCSPGTKGAGNNGCAPQLCNAGYSCASGFVCAVGAGPSDVHGCEALPCSQTGCPANDVCQTTVTGTGGCTPKSCRTDCDCDAGGYCVGGSCSSVPGTCIMPPV